MCNKSTDLPPRIVVICLTSVFAQATSGSGCSEPYERLLLTFRLARRDEIDGSISESVLRPSLLAVTDGLRFVGVLRPEHLAPEERKLWGGWQG
ncbi:predicted protein [Coccidioides posadasii str. Silveira]|uniref:Predicted protein n=1 Tax=Coccidioides posadasii (strain RMSCC 757 / Silveira) TaxID=443226 RepID=E9CZ12_COCPS|nr:predicted protein [Coccidioides posadasii str. Silveira]